MKKFNIQNINTKEYWDTHQTAIDFGLRQKKYLEIAGKGNSIVELGCGLSPMLAFADKFDYRVGVDFSVETIKQAHEAYPDIIYTLADVCYTPFPNESFDVVVAGEVIEHMEDPLMLLNEMKRICKTGGKIIISTPKLEFVDPEHIWEFEEMDLAEMGFDNIETIHSERFKGRSYIFAWTTKK